MLVPRVRVDADVVRVVRGGLPVEDGPHLLFVEQAPPVGDHKGGQAVAEQIGEDSHRVHQTVGTEQQGDGGDRERLDRGSGRRQGDERRTGHTGYSFNLDGAAIYLSLAMMFLAQAVGVDLGFGQQLAIMGILILSSKGMAGVPGSAFVALSATAAAIGAFPVAAVALLLGADRLMDSMRVFTNLLGNCLATFVVANWGGLLDKEKMRAVLDGKITPDDPDYVSIHPHPGHEHLTDTSSAPITMDSPAGLVTSISAKERMNHHV